MMLKIKSRALPSFIPLIVAICVVAVGAFFVGGNTFHHILHANAESDAQRWGGFLARNTPNLAQIIKGTSVLDLGARSFLLRQKPVSVRHFIIYDTNGVVRWDSRTQMSRSPNAEAGEISLDAWDVAKTRVSKFELTETQGATTALKISRVVLPLMDGVRQIGVLEMVADSTLTWEALRGGFQDLSVQFVALILVAFLVPGFLYIRRSGQLAFTARRLQHRVEYDELTGVHNRTTFSQKVRSQLQSATENGREIAIHFIDLDRFKDVNDTHGHSTGDELLQLAAGRLHRSLQPEEFIARLGGDEFAICQPYAREEAERVQALADKVVEVMARPFKIGMSEIQIGASVGFSRFPRDGGDVDELIRTADIALYKAKQSSRGVAIEFAPTMELERQERQAIESRLRAALVRSEFTLNFQPLFESATRELRGFEVLLRLNDDAGKPIPPDVFIPMAEEVGLIGEIGAWVLREACKTAREWPEGVTVSVNLSPAQFQTHDMPSMVKAILLECDMPAHRLELEVTESLLILETDKVLRDLTRIKALGVSIALDDFGTGYSSLSYLWQFPFDKLKVDKSFMTDLALEGSKSRDILSTIMALGKVLDLKITAEGVETEEQASVLRELNCDLVQGYLYGRPMKAVDVASVMLKTYQVKARKQATKKMAAGVAPKSKSPQRVAG